MPLVKINPQPGVNSQLTMTANENGWSSSNLIRWRLGLPEKYAGWQRLIEDPCAGLVRAMHAWLDLSNNKNLLLGTDGGPQVLVNTTLYDLTVLGAALQGGSGGTGLATFSVNNTSTLVTVAVPTTFAVSAGDVVTFQMPISIGRRIIATDTAVTVVGTGVGTFTFNMTSAATVTETAAVGLPFFSFPAPGGGSNLCTVTFARHGLSPGGTFHIDQTTSFVTSTKGFSVTLTIPGGTDLAVSTTPTLDTFTFVYTPYGQYVFATTIYEGESLDASGNLTFGNVLATVRAPSSVSPTSQNWFVDNLGENGFLVFTGSPVYEYVPPIDSGSVMIALGASASPPTAPQVNSGMIAAMPQAQLITWGTEPVLGSGTLDPLLLRWCDAGDPETWEATVSNQAGSYHLSHGSKIMGATQAPQTTLVWTDTDIWNMSYISPPLVYGFNVVGTGCGLVAARAFATIGRTTCWQSTNGFWQFTDGGVAPLPCPVWDSVFRDLDTANIFKCFGAANSSAHEIAFFFPSLQTVPTPPTNLLSYSQVFAQTAVWTASNLSSITNSTAPDSTNTASALIENSVGGVHGVSQIVPKATSSVSYVASVYCKNTSTRNLGITVSNPGFGSAFVVFNPATSAVVTSAIGGVGFSALSTSATTDSYATGLAGNGWVRYNLFITTDSGNQVVFEVDNANGSSLSYTGGGASGVIIWGAQLSLQPLMAYSVNSGFIVTNECSRYVKYNVSEGLWDISEPGEGLEALPRTAWIDNSIFGTPLGADFNYRIQQHEMGYDDDGGPMQNVYAETGYGRMNSGTDIMSVDQCQPDMKWFGENGAVNFILKTVQYPGGPVTEYGPYSVTPTTQYFSTRTRAKQIAQRIEWAPLTGFSARVGATTFRVKPAGRRP